MPVLVQCLFPLAHCCARHTNWQAVLCRRLTRPPCIAGGAPAPIVGADSRTAHWRPGPERGRASCCALAALHVPSPVCRLQGLQQRSCFCPVLPAFATWGLNSACSQTCKACLLSQLASGYQFTESLTLAGGTHYKTLCHRVPPATGRAAPQSLPSRCRCGCRPASWPQSPHPSLQRAHYAASEELSLKRGLVRSEPGPK